MNSLNDDHEFQIDAIGLESKGRRYDGRRADRDSYVAGIMQSHLKGGLPFSSQLLEHWFGEAEEYDTDQRSSARCIDFDVLGRRRSHIDLLDHDIAQEARRLDLANLFHYFGDDEL